ncbi:hypothetical protein RDI58_001235 [Solanum bulbocastanum]|uniref:Uncharacterized protein n=1 Tax=Solanum bulbocastanum TaxID=147425 RepID=A0AAN8UDZ8_SOLBU
MNELLEAVAPFVTGLQETLSGRQEANPQVPDALPKAPSQGLHFPLPEIVGQERGEPFFIRRNESMEASMLNRIRKLERHNCLFLLSKAKGEYWSEVKTTLHNCGSQKEYYRLLCFKNRDLQIRERKHSCFFLFQEILSRNRALRGDAANPTEDFLDFFFGKREVLDKKPLMGPSRERHKGNRVR